MNIMSPTDMSGRGRFLNNVACLLLGILSLLHCLNFF